MLVRLFFISTGRHIVEETADCGWIFAQHFCNRLGASYLALKNVLDEANPAHAEVLNDIKRRFREETFTRESIANVIHAHPELVLHPLFMFFSSADLEDRSACSM
jgi:glutamate dehydrogenase